ncbi:MAG: antibiotic biosynthesis monooxygenase [Deltaproteobacteria bacterium CG12_big_fil_rev_8_21_14_0_65_43_10]|nr:MAG: antibiotic biosynthesis monooxygenase [Deltaproteobacteria bacterium CG2_30_43_15]PIQ44545.1 MAG: antibiotic biosynthesis monooxygenase [Deltaproteobacteria bacterium CG12_big_fil_rev_8_21_14_0_65_43_10]PIU85965.1 MAG: antibiotic biosynthesis monooxygenase [Deltaproteobacteria bacterium CG06_land_8_20_14_3_00_44_19]PIX25897.1 MAG: antibiotic biosynthesis monooxygenase [Deltaproteobacteria bacterium CG_4_8_14_3_um_filter_43_13]PIZ20658.1 MAG: antibiotic biosynthesis monooxygenase [Deltap
MIVVVAFLKAQAGKEREMEDALRAMIPKVQSEEGTLAYVLHRAQNEPGKFLFYEKYKDKAAFDHHGSTSHIQELFGKIGPLLDGKPSIEMYEELAAKK